MFQECIREIVKGVEDGWPRTCGFANDSYCMFGGACEPGGGGPDSSAWSNEVYFDNTGGDSDEGVEIAGPGGLSLTG